MKTEEGYRSVLEKLRGLGMHGMIASRNGKTAAQAVVAPYSLDRPHTMFSVTKSFTSAAVGFCVQEGLLSLDDRAVSFFPLPSRPCGNMEKVTVRHLLTMATGHTKEAYYWPTEQEPLDNFLRSYVEAEPGSLFLYNTGGSHLLGYIAEKVSGRSLEDYLRPRLMEPLGIEDWVWDKHPDGACMGGVGLHLSLRNLLKFGNFLLSEGFCGKRELLSRNWIREATGSRIVQPGEPNTHWSSGYGYQFWLNRTEGYRADGAFGQFCAVIPRLGLVIAMCSGSQDMGGLMDVLFDELVGALDGEVPYHTELPAPAPSGALEVPRKAYRLSPNPFGYERVVFNGREAEVYGCRCGAPERPSKPFCFLGGGTSGYDGLLRVLHMDTPFTDDLHLKLGEHNLTIDLERNVGFGQPLRCEIFGIEGDL